MGTVGTAIAGFAVADDDPAGRHKGGISQGTVQLITLLLLPISIAMIAYALFTFYWRSEFIRRKQVRAQGRPRCLPACSPAERPAPPAQPYTPQAPDPWLPPCRSASSTTRWGPSRWRSSWSSRCS